MSGIFGLIGPHNRLLTSTSISELFTIYDEKILALRNANVQIVAKMNWIKERTKAFLADLLQDHHNLVESATSELGVGVVRKFVCC